ncbi:unnamed protein product [Symbiodinium sp. CCMP2592]|nr:unnamed protein product [Symbiodinium sp. CCMP2592]
MDKAVDTSYRILDLPFGAGEPEIQKAFKSKALQHHPDKGGSASAFQRIQDARNVLLCDLNGPSIPSNACCSKEERQEVSKARAATRAAQREGFETAPAAGNKPGTHKFRSKEKLRSERVAQQAFLVQKAEKAKQANKQCKGSKLRSSQDHKQASAPPSKSDNSPTLHVNEPVDQSLVPSRVISVAWAPQGDLINFMGLFRYGNYPQRHPSNHVISLLHLDVSKGTPFCWGSAWVGCWGQSPSMLPRWTDPLNEPLAQGFPENTTWASNTWLGWFLCCAFAGRHEGWQ